MKKTFFISAVAAFMIIVGLCASCSKKEQQAKKELPPDHEKMVEQMKKGLEQSEDLVVANVNGDKITMNDLIREMNVIAPNFVRPGQTPAPGTDEKVKKNALDILIFGALAVQEAKAQGIKASPEAVDEVIKNLKAKVGSEKAYEAYLVSRQLTENEFRKLITDNILFQKITQKEIVQKVKSVKPGEKELKEIYAREKNSFVMPEAYIAEDIFFAGGKQDEETRNKAKNVLAELKANGNDPSKLTSDGSFVIRKMPVTEGMFPNIYNSLKGVKPGDVSAIIQEKDGLHIVKVEGKEPARTLTFKEARHIIEQQLMNEAIEKRKEEWESQLKKTAKIEISLKEAGGIKPVY
jgi:parvulin-like peptidyl-prolyl isomerase